MATYAEVQAKNNQNISQGFDNMAASMMRGPQIRAQAQWRNAQMQQIMQQSQLKSRLVEAVQYIYKTDPTTGKLLTDPTGRPMIDPQAYAAVQGLRAALGQTINPNEVGGDITPDLATGWAKHYLLTPAQQATKEGPAPIVTEPNQGIHADGGDSRLQPAGGSTNTVQPPSPQDAQKLGIQTDLVKQFQNMYLKNPDGSFQKDATGHQIQDPAVVAKIQGDIAAMSPSAGSDQLARGPNDTSTDTQTARTVGATPLPVRVAGQTPPVIAPPGNGINAAPGDPRFQGSPNQPSHPAPAGGSINIPAKDPAKLGEVTKYLQSNLDSQAQLKSALDHNDVADADNPFQMGLLHRMIPGAEALADAQDLANKSNGDPGAIARFQRTQITLPAQGQEAEDIGGTRRTQNEVKLAAGAMPAPGDAGSLWKNWLTQKLADEQEDAWVAQRQAANGGIMPQFQPNELANQQRLIFAQNGLDKNGNSAAIFPAAGQPNGAAAQPAQAPAAQPATPAWAPPPLNQRVHGMVVTNPNGVPGQWNAQTSQWQQVDPSIIPQAVPAQDTPAPGTDAAASTAPITPPPSN